MPLINCEISWSGNCVLTDVTTQTVRNASSNAKPPVQARERIDALTNAAFQTRDVKLYAPVVNLSIKNDNKLSEQLKSGFKRTTKWNECRAEITDRLKLTN